MAIRKIKLFTEIHNEQEFRNVLQSNRNRLICAEVYSHFFGSCTALDRLFTSIKLDWSDGKMLLLKVPSEEIESLQRYRHQSQPVYLFIINEKITKMMRGVDANKMAEVARQELYYFNIETAGSCLRPLYALDEPTADEKEWMNARYMERKREQEASASRRAARQSERKKHRAELMAPHLRNLNFVLFWPHAHHAHVELYERWDLNNIIMVGREEILLNKDIAEDILYAGDAPINEASMFQLLSKPALAICFRLLDTDKHFVSLVRKILYEEIPELGDDKPNAGPRMTAFDLYKSYSLTREQFIELRRERDIKRKEEVIEKRARRLSEMQRLAWQAHKDTVEAKILAKEQRKLEFLSTGNLAALNRLNEEIAQHEDPIIPEKLPEEIEKELSEGEQEENECLPPAGLLIPGFYAPPNDIAKANGLAVLFPKLVAEHVTPQPEILPPHVLVMLDITQRYAAIEVMHQHRQAIIHMGIFKATTPFDASHFAYSVNQYDQLSTENQSEMKLSFMISVEVDIPLLEVIGLNPIYISRDAESGEEECAVMFPVGYGDQYPEFEDFGDRRILMKID